MSLLWVQAAWFAAPPRENLAGIEPVHAHGSFSYGHDSSGELPTKERFATGPKRMQFEHRLHHPQTGEVMAKAVYSSGRNSSNHLTVDGMAVRRKFQGNGLAQQLHQHLQDQAEQMGQRIYHGERTASGHAAWERFQQSPHFKPELHDEEGYNGPSHDLPDNDVSKRIFGPLASSPEWIHHYVGGERFIN